MHPYLFTGAPAFHPAFGYVSAARAPTAAPTAVPAASGLSLSRPLDHSAPSPSPLSPQPQQHAVSSPPAALAGTPLGGLTDLFGSLAQWPQPAPTVDPFALFGGAHFPADTLYGEPGAGVTHINLSQVNPGGPLNQSESDASSYGGGPSTGHLTAESSRSGSPTMPKTGETVPRRGAGLAMTPLGGGPSMLEAHESGRSMSFPDLGLLASSELEPPAAKRPAAATKARGTKAGRSNSVGAATAEGSSAAAETGKARAAKGGSSLEPPTVCMNCKTSNTPLWRRDSAGNPLCNACGLFRGLHGVDRPLSLNTGIVKKRNRTRGNAKDASKKSSRSRRTSAPNTNDDPSTSSVGRAESSVNIRQAARNAAQPYPSASMNRSTASDLASDARRRQSTG